MQVKNHPISHLCYIIVVVLHLKSYFHVICGQSMKFKTSNNSVSLVTPEGSTNTWNNHYSPTQSLCNENVVHYSSKQNGPQIRLSNGDKLVSSLNLLLARELTLCQQGSKSAALRKQTVQLVSMLESKSTSLTSSVIVPKSIKMFRNKMTGDCLHQESRVEQ